MSLFNALRRALGVNAGDDLQDDTQMNSFDQAGLTGDETTGAVADTTNVNTGALAGPPTAEQAQANAQQPIMGFGGIPMNFQQTNTIGQTTGQVGGQVGGQETGKTGTGTPPPPFATPGIVGGGNTFSPQFIAGGGGGGIGVRVLPGQVVTTTNEKGQKSKSIQDLIEIGGTGFDDEVLARKLRRQAGMPELKNEDYYPNQPFTQAQTAWGDPIFSGARALFPMAAYDAQRKARAQAEIDEAKQNVMQIKIPEIKTGAYVEMVKSGFTNDVTNLTNEYVKKYGGPKKAIQAMRQDGSLANLQARWEGIARSIDQTADRAKEFLKNAQEKSTTMYFSPEGVRAATNFMNGMDAFSKGEITPDMLNQLEQQFRTAERWQTYKDRNIGKLKPTDYIPTPEQLKNITEEDRKSFEAVQLDLGNKAPDFNTWLFTQKYSEAALPQVMKSIVQPFFDENKTAAEQLVLPGEKLEDAKLRIANSISALLGRQYSQGTVTQNQRGKGTTIVLGSGGGKEKQGFWESTVLGNNEITTSLKNNINNPNINITDAIEQSFGGSWRVRPNDPYVRVSVPGQQYKGTVTPERYDDYVMPTPASGTGAASGQYAPIGKDKNGKDILMQFGVTDRGQTPKAAKIVGAEMGYAVRDPKTKQWNLITQENLKKNGLPPGAKQVVIESQLLYNAPLEETEGTSITMESGANIQGGGSARRGETKGLKAYRIYEATLENTRHLDNATNPTTSNEGAINPGGTGGFSGSVTVEDASL